MPISKRFMKGTRWYVTREGGRFNIRREDELGRHVRYPAVKYAKIREDEAEVAALVKRLNYRADAEDRARKAFDDKIAFVKNAVLDEFRVYLEEQIPSKVYVSGIYGHVRTHFLGYFQNVLGLKDPLEWHKVHKEKWARYLTDSGLSPKTKRAVVQAANRFMQWLHERNSDVPLLVFKPITRAKYKTLAAEYEARTDVDRAKFVTDEDWEKIKKALPEHLAPFAILAYHYGLRRAESLALRPGDVRNKYLSVERQVVGVKRDSEGKVVEARTKILKGKENRKVPHWFSSPAKTYKLIEATAPLVVHPDTLGKEWAEFVTSIGLDYGLHDLRHTWITKAMRKYGKTPRDVQLAAGHKNIETTMDYLHDDRELDDKEWKPTG